MKFRHIATSVLLATASCAAAAAGENGCAMLVGGANPASPQGVPAQNGEPGTALAPQHVLSCPAL